MKKTHKLLILLALVCTLLVCGMMSASALEFTGKAGEKITWTYNTSTDVIKFEGSGKMNDYGVLGPTPWNLHKATIKEVVIGNGITHIGNNSFEACAINKVTIADTVTSIGNDAFRGCYNLESIVIPDSVTEMGVSVFETCGKLKYVELSENLTEINNRVFHGTDIRDVVIPYGVTKIGDRAFYMCWNLGSVIMPDTVERIETEAFLDCHNLSTAYLGNGLKHIGDAAFFHCTSLYYVYYPSTLESKGLNVYNSYVLLKNISIDKGSIKITDFDMALDSVTKVYFTGTEDEWKAAGHLSNYNGSIEFNHAHGFVGLKYIKKATCVYGYMLQKCDCGASRTIKIDPVKDHTFIKETNVLSDKEATCRTEGLSTYRCTVCNTIENRVTPINPSNHADGRYTVLIQTTCTESGSEHFECPCGYEITTDVQPYGHNYKGTIIEATCEENKRFSGTCTRCGIETTEIRGEALGHSFNVYTHICSRCGVHVTDVCSHMCHKNDGRGTAWYRFCRFFWKLFKTNLECSCGMKHY